MDSDRGLSSLVRVSVGGKIDFSLAKLSDKAWWRKLKWTLAESQRLEFLEYQHVRMIKLAGQMGLHRIEENSFSKLQDAANNTLEDIRKKIFGTIETKTEKQDYKAQWSAVFGDLDSPETQSKIDRWLEAMEDLNKKPAPNPSAAAKTPRIPRMSRRRLPQ